jgi:hypothetical protein
MEIATAYVNSEHSVFKERTHVPLKSESLTTNELVGNDFTVVKRQVADTISKVVNRLLINKPTEKLRHLRSPFGEKSVSSSYGHSRTHQAD